MRYVYVHYNYDHDKDPKVEPWSCMESFLKSPDVPAFSFFTLFPVGLITSAQLSHGRPW